MRHSQPDDTPPDFLRACTMQPTCATVIEFDALVGRVGKIEDSRAANSKDWTEFRITLEQRFARLEHNISTGYRQLEIDVARGYASVRSAIWAFGAVALAINILLGVVTLSRFAAKNTPQESSQK